MLAEIHIKIQLANRTKSYMASEVLGEDFMAKIWQTSVFFRRLTFVKNIVSLESSRIIHNVD